MPGIVLHVVCCLLCFLNVSGHAIKLEEVFDVVKEIHINLDVKMDEAIRLAAGKVYGDACVACCLPVRLHVMGEDTLVDG